ncbi:hypothetical protein CEXT_743481 [Caerostris extrusa]|uniref:Uncharacterized protein n=1 Tax=Caerostris extrusa TaxID=172846 RepID=A0AAV4X5W7_CAEEX|nr:hypothetical protein CEXT_743481 [Caerostris extrusa]
MRTKTRAKGVCMSGFEKPDPFGDTFNDRDSIFGVLMNLPVAVTSVDVSGRCFSSRIGHGIARDEWEVGRHV